MNVYVYKINVTKACVDFEKYSVYVYYEGGQPHHLPHCQVRWPGGNCQLELPTLRLIAGPDVPRSVKEFILEHLDEVIAKWNELNVDRTVEQE